MKLEFLTDFLKILKYQILWNSVQWEQSYSIWTDEHDGANNRFRNFVNTPNNAKVSPVRTLSHV
jgi:hypothetical protein